MLNIKSFFNSPSQEAQPLPPTEVELLQEKVLEKIKQLETAIPRLEKAIAEAQDSSSPMIGCGFFNRKANKRINDFTCTKEIAESALYKLNRISQGLASGEIFLNPKGERIRGNFEHGFIIYNGSFCPDSKSIKEKILIGSVQYLKSDIPVFVLDLTKPVSKSEKTDFLAATQKEVDEVVVADLRLVIEYADEALSSKNLA